ncbi:MAG: hypothetical protein HC796_12385, partial [Synechococcaceae cyanobacterium RL_1_2]|nr:hypothetical protein [Synechococcaceae cyanobacterium RL_1_2]
PHQRRSPSQKELVLIPNNEARMIQAQGYLANANEPNFEDELPLGTAQAKEGVAAFCEESINMGIGVE